MMPEGDYLLLGSAVAMYCNHLINECIGHSNCVMLSSFNLCVHSSKFQALAKSYQ